MKPDSEAFELVCLLDYARNAFQWLRRCRDDPGMPTDWTDLLANVAKIKLSGGLVGKVCTVIMVVVVAIAAIVVAVRIEWLAIVALVLIFVLAFTLLWRLMNFAEKNPQAALLDGAEFIAHARLQRGTKSRPTIPMEDPVIQPVPTLPAPSARAVEQERSDPEVQQ
jgi:hypothetical protein